MRGPTDLSKPFRGRVFRYGDHVNTDLIFPGRYTYTATLPEEVAKHALEDLDPTFATRVRPGDIVVAGRNWGCGSSREQAATCLRHAGVGAIVARSFSRIFYRNALNNGLPTIICPEAVDSLADGDEVEVDLQRSRIRWRTNSFAFTGFGPALREMIEAGGLIEHTRRRLAASGRAAPYGS